MITNILGKGFVCAGGGASFGAQRVLWLHAPCIVNCCEQVLSIKAMLSLLVCVGVRCELCITPISLTRFNSQRDRYFDDIAII